MSARKRKVASPDPVFAAIECQKELSKKWLAAGENPRAYAAYNAGIDKLLVTKPTTRAGAAAQIKFCLQEKSGLFADLEGSYDEPLTLLKTLAKAMPNIA